MFDLRPQDQNDQAHRLILIDLLRGMSIGLVMAIHLGFGRFLINSPQFSDVLSRAPLWNLIAQKGGYGVSIFFVLSGFLISGILIKPDQSLTTISLREFYVRRAARILPLLLFFSLISVVLMSRVDLRQGWAQFCLAGPWKDLTLWASIGTFTFNFFRIANDHAPQTFGLLWGILWSLSIEEQFYVFYPIVVRKIGSLRRLIAFLITLVAVGVLWRWRVASTQPDNYLLSLTSTLGAFDQIAAGCLLFFALRHVQRDRNPRREGAVGAVVLGLLLIVAVIFGTSLYNAIDRIYGPTLLALGVCLFLWGGLQFSIQRTPLWSFLCLPGRLSYGMYILHPAVLYLSRPLLMNANPWLAYTVFTGVTISVCYLCFYGYEMPLNSWIRRRFGLQKT